MCGSGVCNIIVLCSSCFVFIFIYVLNTHESVYMTQIVNWKKMLKTGDGSTGVIIKLFWHKIFLFPIERAPDGCVATVGSLR